jgi:hypothetical protein
MDAVDGEDNHDGEVGDEQRGVEGIPGIEAFKGLIGVLGFEEVAEAVGRVEGQMQGDRQPVEKTDNWIEDAGNRGDQKTPPEAGGVGCCYSVMIRQVAPLEVLAAGLLRRTCAMA